MYRRFFVALLLSLTVLVGGVQAERILWFPFDHYREVTCPFGDECYLGHEGVDYACENETPIYASIAGTVLMVNDFPGQSCSWSFGNQVKITGGNYRVIEAHMLQGSIVVNDGDYVEAGQYLGLSSNSGYTLNGDGECMQGGGYHLHLQVEVWENDSWTPVDPYVHDGGMWTDPLMYGGTYLASYSDQTPHYPPGLDYYPVAPGQILDVSFTFNNDGTAFWTNDGGNPHYVELHSVTEQYDADRPSELAYNWIDGSAVRIATTTGNVDPGGQGLYSFQIQAPADQGDYYLYVALYHPAAEEYFSGVGPLLKLGVGTLIFSDPVNYPTEGTTPYSVCAADLDGDNDKDLAVANTVSDDVSILLNNGDGTFQTAVRYGVGESPMSVFSADLDGDGDIDLAVPNNWSHNVSILLNNGDGTFQTAVNYPCGTNPNEVFSADLDGDNDRDLAVANGGSNDVKVLRNNGDGTFYGAISYAVAGIGPRSVICGDLDNDGDNDIVIANLYSDNISVLKNNGTGTFQAGVSYYAGDGPHAISCVDFDLDGHNDLAIADLYSGQISILMNNGNGTFSAPVSNQVGIYPSSTSSADFDGDGDKDLAVTNFTSDNVSVLQNNGDGTFQVVANLGVGDGPHSICSADFDSDGDDDLVTANALADNVSILFNLGDIIAIELLEETVDLLPDDFTEEIAEAGTADQGSNTTAEIINDYVAKSWYIILNWSGSELKLSAFRPDSTLFGEWQSAEPPLTAELIPDDTGTWTFVVTAIDIPHNNYPFALVIGSQPLGSVSGTVADSVAHGLYGVVVDLYDNANQLLSCATTDAEGQYAFPNLVPAEYVLTVVTPMGFVADTENKPITVAASTDSLVNFVLTPLEIIPSQRGIGFWKHQVNVHLSGRGNAQVSLEELSSCMNLIGSHFNNNPENPIILFIVDQPASQTDSLSALQTILTVNGNALMNERARQHLLALLLNVVSRRLSQADTSFSEDGLTVSQAITYGYQLITDADPANDETAKDIAETINNGLVVATGLIPLNIPNISYKQAFDGQTLPLVFELQQNYPNPFNPVATITYSLPQPSQVTLSIYNLLGQEVAVLVDEHQSAGEHQVSWNASNYPSGIYFYRLTTATASETKKMVLLK